MFDERGTVSIGRRWPSAALAIGAILFVSSCDGSAEPLAADEPSASGDPSARSPLARSLWQPGDPAMAGQAEGELTIDDDGCVRLLLAPDEPELSILWPEGWTAHETGDGIEVHDLEGSVVGRTGGYIQVSGGFIDPERYDAQECAQGRAFEVVWASTEPMPTEG